ncbi:MAG: TonB-dependent receptor [Gammaproteobacteria bacterium]|nr:MAG: TonB-dependent receptor [Gammaproteobacteria bacterium]
MKKELLLSALISYAPLSSAKELLEIQITSGIRSEQPEVNTPNQITVISQQDIVASGAKTVTDVLRGHAGLQITDLRGDGSSTTISVRGFAQTANANVLVLVDGRRLNHSDTRNPDISHISLNDVEQIEIIQGSAGVLYGNQAVGGVVNIITRKPVGKHMNVAFDLGSYDRRAARFNISEKLDNGFSYRVAAEALESDGYRDHSSRDFRNLNGFLSYSYDSGELFAELQQVKDDLELPGALVQEEYDADRRQSNTGFVNDFSDSTVSVFRLGVKQTINPNWTFEGEITQRDTDEKLTQSFQNNPSPPGGETSRDQASINPRLIGSFQTSRGDALVTLGIDAEDTDFDLFVPFSFFGFPGAVDRSNDQQTKAVYAQAVIPLTNQLSLTVGGRHASVDNQMVDTVSFPAGIDVDDDVFVKTLGLNYRPDLSWRFYARLDENFRFAKVDEITLAPAGTILDTQTGLSFDVGMEWSRQDRFINFGVYRLELEDEIYFDPTVGIFGANTNLDDTLRYGLVASGGLALTDKISVSADYTYTHAKFEAGGLDGQYISGVAPRIATMRMDLRPTDYWNWQAELQMVSSKYAQGDNLNVREKAPGYGILNLSARYQIKQWEFAFRMNNVTDKQYAEFIADGFTRSYQPSPERNILTTVKYIF